MKEEYFLNLLKIYNQTHILRHYQSLSLLEKEKFMGEIGNLDFELAFSLYEKASVQKFPVKHRIDIYPSPILGVSDSGDVPPGATPNMLKSQTQKR